MITLRYHIITIASVFFSLGLGIILGGSIGENWINEKQQNLLIGLEEKYDQAVRSNEDLQKQIRELSLRIEQANQEFSALVSNSYLTDLQGKKIGLWVQQGMDIQGIRHLLESVGLEIVMAGENAPPEGFSYPVLLVGQERPQWTDNLPKEQWIQITSPESSPAKQWELLRKIQHVYKVIQYEY